MKSLRLLALATLAFACTTSPVQACDAPKTAKANKNNSSTTTSAVGASTNGQVPAVSAEGGCSAHAMASGAQCTGATAAACQKNASVAAAMGCSGKGASATTASKSGGCGFHSATTATVAGLRCIDHQNGVAHECNA